MELTVNTDEAQGGIQLDWLVYPQIKELQLQRLSLCLSRGRLAELECVKLQDNLSMLFNSPDVGV